MKSTGAWGAFRAFLKRKNVEFSAKRYGIDALGAMAQGLFASCSSAPLSGPWRAAGTPGAGGDRGLRQGSFRTGHAAAIGYALKCPPLVLFSLIAVGGAANTLGGAGGPLAVLVVAIVASECGRSFPRRPRSISL